MSRLILNITHSTGGGLGFTIQSDNADEQVGLLANQLATAQRTIDELTPDPDAEDPRNREIADLNGIVDNQRLEISRLGNELRSARNEVSVANQALLAEKAKRKPARKKAPSRRKR